MFMLSVSSKSKSELEVDGR